VTKYQVCWANELSNPKEQATLNGVNAPWVSLARFSLSQSSELLVMLAA